MDEKVLREIKIVETEDGFRIEMKGDKEELRKMISDQSRPFFAWGEQRGPFGGRGPFGKHGPFGEHGSPFEHLREHHERHHGHHHDHEHEHGPFGFRGEPRPEGEGDPRVEALRDHHRQHGPFGFRGQPRPDGEGDPRVEALRDARRNWKFKRGGYDLGPWWDEGAQDEQPGDTV